MYRSVLVTHNARAPLRLCLAYSFLDRLEYNACLCLAIGFCLNAPIRNANEKALTRKTLKLREFKTWVILKMVIL